MNIIALLQTPFVRDSFLLIPLLIVLDLITGVVSAIVHHDFSGKEVMNFAHSEVLPYVGIVAIIASAMIVGTPVEAVAAAYSLTISGFAAREIASIVENVGEVFGLPYLTVVELLMTLIQRFFPGANVNAPTNTPNATYTPNITTTTGGAPAAPSQPADTASATTAQDGPVASS